MSTDHIHHSAEKYVRTGRAISGVCGRVERTASLWTNHARGLGTLQALSPGDLLHLLCAGYQVNCFQSVALQHEEVRLVDVTLIHHS